MTGSKPTTTPIVLHETNFEKVLAESDLPVLFEFWASWCHHCKALEPIMDQVAEEMAGKVIVGQINCDMNRELCRKYEVKAVPVIFLAKQGKVVGTILNPKDKEILLSWLKDALP